MVGKSPKGIVFDLDGTLVDSLATTFEAFNEALSRFGVRKHTPQEIMKHFGPGEGEIFARLVGAERSERACEIFRSYLDANVDQVPLHEGVGDLLEQLKSSGIPIAIFTGRAWDTTQLILNHHHLMDRFITVVASDHVGHSKPSPEGLHLALSRMKLEPAQALFVGDSHVDLLAARAAGSVGVAALWDWLAHREHLAAHQPHHYAEKPADVWEILRAHKH